MESSALIGSLEDQILLLGLACSRIAAAFMLMPLFSTDLVPALVRNSMVVGLSLLALALQPPLVANDIMHANVAVIVIKELFIGCVLGFFFSSMLWAFEAAGALIDTKIGSTQGQLSDPLTGQQVPITGAFLGRLSNFVFMFSGGMLLFMGTLFESYVWWPIMSFEPVLFKTGMSLFESEFNRLMVLTLMLSAPILVVLYAVDGVLGLVNRYAPQLNLFSLAGSLKTWVGIAMLLMLMTSMTQQLIADIQTRPAIVLRTLKALMGTPGS